MQRRASERLALTLTLVLAGAAYADVARPAVVAEGLADPAGLAVRAGPRGGVEVIVAEAGAGRLTAFELLGDREPRPTPLADGLSPGPKAVGWADDNTLLAATDALVAFRVERPGTPAEEAARAEAESFPEAMTTLVANERHVFGVGGGALWRSRRIAGRFAELRFVSLQSTKVAGATFSPRGYLVALQADTRDAGTEAGVHWKLVFLDPENVELGGAEIPVEGLADPLAIAYSSMPQPVEPCLYALGRDGAWRLDSHATADGALSATATRVATIDRPVTFAPGPDGAFYVVTSSDRGVGTLLRLVVW